MVDENDSDVLKRRLVKQIDCWCPIGRSILVLYAKE